MRHSYSSPNSYSRMTIPRTNKLSHPQILCLGGATYTLSPPTSRSASPPMLVSRVRTPAVSESSMTAATTVERRKPTATPSTYLLKMWCRYVDDVLAIWPNVGEQLLEEFHQHLNGQNPSIQFTVEERRRARLFSSMYSWTRRKFPQFSTRRHVQTNTSTLTLTI